jgi:hypothetical protein
MAARESAAEPSCGAAPSGAAHCPQNLNCGGFSARHLAQILIIGAAQLPQNFIPAGLSKPHREQIIVVEFRLLPNECKRLYHAGATMG